MADELAPLTPVQAAALLRAAGAMIRVELGALPPAALAWHPASGEWCILEVLGHLIEAEQRGFAGRVRQLLAEERPRFQAWDQAAVAGVRRDCGRDPQALVEEFGRLREASVALVAGLREADLARGGDHPTVGYLRVVDLLHEWVYHDRDHLRQILANVQALAWPHLGNAQRFSQS